MRKRESQIPECPDSNSVPNSTKRRRRLQGKLHVGCAEKLRAWASRWQRNRKIGILEKRGPMAASWRSNSESYESSPHDHFPRQLEKQLESPRTSDGHGFGSSRRFSATVAVRYLMLENAPRAAESIHAVQFNLGSGAQRTLRQVLSG